jgi:cold shock CspA family protein/ribosome-associated translation inhibitor RaiA
MEIHWRNAQEIDAEQRAKAAAQLEKLAEHHRDLIDLFVDVERASAHHKQATRRVEIRCQARGAHLVANGEGGDVALALREALRTFRREVERLRGRRRDARAERPAEPPLRGVIDRVERAGGFGFLITDAGERVYFHRNAVGGGLEFDRLEGGETVALNYEAGSDGLQATFVRSVEGA